MDAGRVTLAPQIPIELRFQPVAELGEHTGVSSAFTSSVLYDAAFAAASRELHERETPRPFTKDYDALEHPASWLAFDVSRWILIGAYVEGRRVGGVIVAVDTPGVDMLEGRGDLAVIWDLRVAPEARGMGVGSALLRAAEAWAVERGCAELKVETQNVNVPACRLYRSHGCVLSEAVAQAYPGLPDEVQLIWRKRIGVSPSRPSQVPSPV